MKLMEKLERKFHGRGIPNLTVYIIICYVAGYILQMISPQVMNLLSLDIYYVIHRFQIWRLITWIISPPTNNSVFWFILAVLFFYYPIGTMLENIWGSFRYTLYIFSGIFFTVIGAFIVYFITGGIVTIGGVPYMLGGSIYSTMYISLSVFLAYAFTNPDQRILLYFVIPIKMKWMAYVYIAFIAYDIFNDIRNGMWFMIIPILASLLNFVIFYFSTKDMSRYNPKEVKRRNDFKKATAASRVNPAKGITKHKCAICGRTEVSNPELEFRFCTRCAGNYEYCSDHLFTHPHK